MTRRTERVGEQLRGELARLLREEITDPRIGLVTLTRVDVSPDLRNARIYWSRLGTGQPSDEELAESDSGLESAAGFLRRRLARLLEMRRVPELHFVHDPSLALGARTLELLKDLQDGSDE